jgi:hypothetical protein
MASVWLRRCDWLMRVSHLYTGLFLVPWMTIYAVSAFCLNHRTWFADIATKWETVRETEFRPDSPLPEIPEEQGRALLDGISLTGPFQVASSDANQLTLYRYCAAGLYRVGWQRQSGRVLVEQQLPATAYSYVNNLHFRAGYTQPFLADVAWAVIVDAVTISTIAWIVSGIYIWARRPRKLLGGLCLVGGCLLFAVLAVLLGR